MIFAPENPLEEALARATSDPSVRVQFYDLLMQSPLLVLGNVENHHDPDEILSNLYERRFELFQITVRDRHYHPVFTAMSRLRAFKPGTEPHFTVRGRTLFSNTRGAAFLINFGSDVGKALLPQEIDHVLEPKLSRRQQAANRNGIAISQPDPYPGKLTGALGIFFLNRSQVVTAHLVQAVLSDKEPPHLLIGLVAHGNPRRIIAEIGEVATAMHISQTVDVMVLDPAKPRSELQTRLLAIPPFYARAATSQS